MKIDHVSCVVLGHFNPAILTPAFLTERCSMPPVSSKLIKKQYSRLASEIIYEDIKFLALPDRLQVNERHIEKLQDSKVCEYTLNYLKVLQFTPIAACGLNFHFTGFSEHVDISKKGTRKSLLHSLGTDDLNWIENFKLDKKGDEELLAFTLKGFKEDYKIQLEWTHAEARLNVNFEQQYTIIPVAPNAPLQEYASSPKLIEFLSKFEELCNHCEQFVQVLKKG